MSPHPLPKLTGQSGGKVAQGPSANKHWGGTFCGWLLRSCQWMHFVCQIICVSTMHLGGMLKYPARSAGQICPWVFSYDDFLVKPARHRSLHQGHILEVPSQCSVDLQSLYRFWTRFICHGLEMKRQSRSSKTSPMLGYAGCAAASQAPVRKPTWRNLHCHLFLKSLEAGLSTPIFVSQKKQSTAAQRAGF